MDELRTDCQKHFWPFALVLYETEICLCRETVARWTNVHAFAKYLMVQERTAV